MNRDNLKNHTDQEVWKTSAFSQLDAKDKYNMFGPTCIILPGVIVLRQFWTYVIKLSGKRKSRNNCYVYPINGKGV